jgi:uncharacterized protein (DUF1786 family)
MKILAVDVGTGTQDILLFDSRLNAENGFKMVLPAPTMITHRHLKDATQKGQAVALTGVTMGGGPSHWAAEAHLKAGYAVFATPDAARTFNDDLDMVGEMGIEVIGEDEVSGLPGDVLRLDLKDFDFELIAKAFAHFDISLDDLDAVAVAVFDHGAAPPNYSDRQFRFDYIAERAQINRQLTNFAFMAQDIPKVMTRLHAVGITTKDIDMPVVLMDTAPAAVLGALLDTQIDPNQRQLITNVGNFHTIGFRLGVEGIEGVFEHHTGHVDTAKLDDLLLKLAQGTLTHKELFDDHGHGALILDPTPLDISKGPYGVVVTGPRRSMMETSKLRPYYAVPFGDMMIAGCFGLLVAVADKLPKLREQIMASLRPKAARTVTPWDV